MTVDKFFSTARERYSILLKRRAGLPKPWSEDPIFQREYFCNVFREDDRTTQWFRENIRDKVRNDPQKALLAIAAFRWFNKIETGEKIKDLLIGEWNSLTARDRLRNQKPVVTGAYIIKTPDGLNKLDGVLWCIDMFKRKMDEGTFNLLFRGCSMQTACAALGQSPYLGNFMSWQICSDARQTSLLENAPDKDTWAQPGPGSTRGLGRVFHNKPEHFNYGSQRDKDDMLALMNQLSSLSEKEEYWPQEWRKLAVVDISHWLCEFDKNCRAAEGGRMKRKYGGL